MAKILFIEDDLDYAQAVKDLLQGEHHHVEMVDNGRAALELLKVYKFDVIIIDWGVPEISGLEVCARFRSAGGTTPILILTGKTNVSEKETGLDAGADDYLTKPADPRELSARVRALARRSPGISGNLLKIRHIALDSTKHIVTKNDEVIELYPKEFSLLEYLMRHPNQVFSADDLLDRVWSSDSESSPHTVRSCINRLRLKLDQEGTESIIRTIYSVGYTVPSE